MSTTVEAEATVTIPLPSGRVAVVDWQDRHLADLRWGEVGGRRGKRYAARRFPGSDTKVMLHKLVVGAGPGQTVDHVNGDILDCRRANLRPSSPLGNARNRRKRDGCSSKYKGVSWYKAGGLWEAAIKVDDCRRHLGRYRSEVEAARAYDGAARRLFGADAALNFPRPGEQGCRRR